MSDSSSKEKLLNEKDGHEVRKLLGSLQPNITAFCLCVLKCETCWNHRIIEVGTKPPRSSPL